jgi:hypothetical protein
LIFLADFRRQPGGANQPCGFALADANLSHHIAVAGGSDLGSPAKSAGCALGAQRHRALIEHGMRYLTTGDPALGRR